MATLNDIDPALLPVLRRLVKEEVRQALKEKAMPNGMVTYRQASSLFGWTYMTIRSHVNSGKFKNHGTREAGLLSLKELEAYYLNRGPGGAPRSGKKVLKPRSKR